MGMKCNKECIQNGAESGEPLPASEQRDAPVAAVDLQMAIEEDAEGADEDADEELNKHYDHEEEDEDDEDEDEDEDENDGAQAQAEGEGEDELSQRV